MIVERLSTLIEKHKDSGYITLERDTLVLMDIHIDTFHNVYFTAQLEIYNLDCAKLKKWSEVGRFLMCRVNE